MNEVATIMSAATKAFQAGEFAQARDLSGKAVRSAPDNLQIIQFHGIAQIKAGEMAAGLATLRNLLSRRPDDDALRLNTAHAALDSGKPELVDEICAPLGNDANSLFLRSQAAKLTGDPSLATSLLERLAAEQPTNVRVINNLGNALLELGRSNDAVKQLTIASRLAPSEAQIWLNLGRAHAQGEDFENAVTAFEQARKLQPTSQEICFELGKSLLRHDRHEQALACLADAARLGLRDPQVFVLIGLCFTALEQRTKAEEAFRMALHLDPLHARAVLNLGIFLEQENRIEDLRKLVADSRARGLEGPDLEYCEALLLRRDGDFGGALEKASRSNPEGLDSVVRNQLIGQLADRLGRVDEAFASFSLMNEATSFTPEASRYDGTEYWHSIGERTATITPDWYESWSRPPISDGRDPPIILGGFLRSGTTLLDTALMGHPSTHVREEEGMLARMEDVAGPIVSLPEFSEREVATLRDAYFTELLAGGPFPSDKLLIDKYPLMTLRAAYIHRAFSDAKFVFALRHPMDVVLSCWMQNFRITRAMASFLTLENAARLYDAAMTHWTRCRDIMPLDVHTIRYEDMTRDFEGEIRRLIDFLDLPWESALLDHQKTAKERGYIRTPSYSQVMETIYIRASGRWERYRHHLEPVLPILSPWIEKFGYDPVEV